MSRARRPEDWEVDLSAARAAESEIAGILAGDPRIVDLADHTYDFEELDFSFRYADMHITVDLKEKRQPYSSRYRSMWPELPPEDLFIVDETVYRRVIWQGGGGYLLVHDHPARRWVVFGPWELTLGPRIRYQRWGRRSGPRFPKGKLLLDLGAAALEAPVFSVDDLLEVIDRSMTARDAVEAVATHRRALPEIE